MTPVQHGPPPLVPESVSARLLFRVWSGERIIRAWPQAPDADITQVVAIVVAHMHLRAGFSILVTGGQDCIDECLERISTLVPPESVEPKYDPTVGVAPAVRFALVDRPPDTFSAAEGFDLIVMADRNKDADSVAFHYLTFGRQFLSFGRLSHIDFDDRDGLNMPLDVVLAGGVP